MSIVEGYARGFNIEFCAENTCSSLEEVQEIYESIDLDMIMLSQEELE
ncbi:MAG: hypothetical protein QX191_09055 [Methylococcaceae bacterium]